MLLIGVFIGCLLASPSSSSSVSQDSLDKAIQHASEYLWEQRDVYNQFWPSPEAASAIISLASQFTGVDGADLADNTTDPRILSIRQNMAMVHVDFLKNLALQGFDIGKIDDRLLTEVVGALRLTCSGDPKDYFGFDLIEEVHNRVRTVNKMHDGQSPPLSYPALLLVLCQDGEHFNFRRALAKLSPRKFKDQPFFLEQSAMSSMALTCMYDEAEGAASTTFKKQITDLQSRLMTHVYEGQSKQNGGFETIYATALALHADLDRKVEAKAYEFFDPAAAQRWLLDSQKPDGSFGDSITITGLAMTALTQRPLHQAKLVNCEKFDERRAEINRENGNVIHVPFVIRDEIVTRSAFVGRIRTHDKKILKDVLEEYARENPETFRLKMTENFDGITIDEINGVPKTAAHSWDVFHHDEYIRALHGKTTPAYRIDVRKETVRDGKEYVLAFH